MAKTQKKTTTPANDNGDAKLVGTQFLQAKQAAAIAAIGNLNLTIQNLLEGCGAVGERATVTAYDFTTACMDDLASASKLKDWANATPQTGANPYSQPLNLLAPDKTNVIRSKISIWAKVFRSAHKAGIAPDDFVGHVNRHGSMRNWYDMIVKMEKAANDNEPVGSDKGEKMPGQKKGKVKRKKVPPTPDFADKVNEVSVICMAVIDQKALDDNPLLQSTLDMMRPYYLGLAHVDDADCRKFLNDNDPRFVGKGVA